MFSRLYCLFYILSIHVVIFVNAHGYVGRIDIGSESYTGNVPGGQTSDSIIHQISTIDPVLGAHNPDVNCGRDATLASQVSADVQPGSTVKVFWTGGGGQRWPHNTGPMLTYLAKCDDDCSSFDTTKARWFKINQIGWRNGEWVQTQLMDAKPHTFQFPSNLAPGGYIMRHEVIALHNAVSRGGAEFYPSCANLNVVGSGSGGPEDSELVSFPGVYEDDNPGIYIPSVYDGDQSDYPFPGPNIAAFMSQQGDSGGDDQEENDNGNSGGVSPTSSNMGSQPTKSSSSFTPSGAPNSEPTAAPVAKSFAGQCRLKSLDSSLKPSSKRKRHLFGEWGRRLIGYKSPQ